MFETDETANYLIFERASDGSQGITMTAPDLETAGLFQMAILFGTTNYKDLKEYMDETMPNWLSHLERKIFTVGRDRLTNEHGDHAYIFDLCWKDHSELWRG